MTWITYKAFNRTLKVILMCCVFICLFSFEFLQLARKVRDLAGEQVHSAKNSLMDERSNITCEGAEYYLE
jgi:hypothetical protein